MTTSTPATRPRPDLVVRKPDGGLRVNFHPGQTRAWRSPSRFVAVLAGTRAGKTAFGPWWLDREIRRRGGGDYLAVTSNFALFDNAMRPALLEVFEHTLKRGRYWGASRAIEIADPTTGRFLAKRATDRMWARILLRSAEAPGGLEAATAKAAWLDEVGQDSFTVGAWEAVLRRVSIHTGRVLLGTTVYNFNWLKAEVYDRWLAGDPAFEVVHFDSTMNPIFPRAEWDRAKATMPAWRFEMQYRGRYDRPAGMIYDCFLDAAYPNGHLWPRFEIPSTWDRFVGLDFGGANTAAVFFAKDPNTGIFYAYREYLAGGLKAADHADAILEGEPRVPTCVGGSKSEGQWRNEFSGKLHVYAPEISDVELGINRVYGAIKAGDVLVFDDLTGLLGELGSYSRKLDAAGLPTAEIQDKSKAHRLDAVRYILGWLRPGVASAEVGRNVLAGYRG